MLCSYAIFMTIIIFYDYLTLYDYSHILEITMCAIDLVWTFFLDLRILMGGSYLLLENSCSPSKT
jgi:hypothetical protein